MEPPLKQRPQYVFPDGEVVDLGEFNFRWDETQGSRITAADEYIVMSKDAAVLKVREGDPVVPGRVFRWEIKFAGLFYEYMVVSEFEESVGGWVMRRTDEMPRTEPRYFGRNGERIMAPGEILEEIRETHRVELSTAEKLRAVKWKAQTGEARSGGDGPVAKPWIPLMEMPDHQALLVFRAPAERDMFLAWLHAEGWGGFLDSLG